MPRGDSPGRGGHVLELGEDADKGVDDLPPVLVGHPFVLVLPRLVPEVGPQRGGGVRGHSLQNQFQTGRDDVFKAGFFLKPRRGGPAGPNQPGT